VKRIALRPQSLSPVSFGVVIATFFVMAGEGAINPVLPLFGKALGGSVSIVGVLIASAGVSRVLFNLPAGRAADAVGRRPLLIFSPIVALAAAIVAPASSAIWQLILLRLVAGIGTGAFMTASIVLLSDIGNEAERIRAIAAYRAAVIVGVLVGPVVGGLAAEIGGPRLAFFFQATVCAFASLWSYLRIPADVSPFNAAATNRPAHTPFHIEVRALLANRDLVLVSLVTFNMFFMLTGARQAIIPLLGEDRLGLEAGGLGLLFGLISLTNLLSIWPAARIGRRYGPKPVIVASGCVSALSLVVFAAAQNTVTFALGGALMGIGTGLASPTTASYAAGVSPSASRGSAMGLYQTVGDSGFVVGPLLLGWIAVVAGMSAGLLFNAGVALIVSAAFALCATSGARGSASANASPVGAASTEASSGHA
jgi:MFS family permease